MPHPRIISRYFIGALVSLITVVVALSGCATIRSTEITDTTLTQRIQQATTSADHSAIAAYYDNQARAAEKNLLERKRARRHYAHEPPAIYYPAGTSFGILEHYDRLIEGYGQTVRESHAMADWHRRLAEMAEHGHGAE